MTDRELYLHLGFYKTGTSYLQKHIFPKMKGIIYHDTRYESAATLFELITTGRCRF